MRPTESSITQESPPSRETSVSWRWVASSSRREKSAEGMILGCAIGEALALPRDRMPRRRALKIFGGTPTRFQFQPGVGVPGERTHGLLMTVQAMLESRADHRAFGRKLRRRMAWYRLSFPIRTLGRWVRPSLPAKGRVPMPRGLASDPLIRGVPISLLIQGSQHAQPWVEQSTRLSVNDGRGEEACLLIAHATQLAQMMDPSETPISPIDAFAKLESTTEDAELQKGLERLRGCWKQGHSVLRAARTMGWEKGIPPDLRAIALIAIYAWLRHPNRFRLAVERTVLLGGECAAAAALVGALSGTALGKRGIPPEWLKRVSLYPHDKDWREDLINRVKDWPHGVEDIQKARSQPSLVLGQLMRNVSFSLFKVIHLAIRIPSRLVPYR
ncbi:ADP-ribosylglycohydrolase family protein [Pirellulaceae bacterium SH501]